MVQVLGSLPTMWRTWNESPIPTSVWPNTSHCGHLGNETVNGELSFSVSASQLKNKIILKTSGIKQKKLSN